MTVSVLSSLPGGSDAGFRFGPLAALYKAAFVFTVLAACAPAIGGAEEGGNPARPAPIRFRRHFVPESETERQVKAGYMPIRRERFDQMLGEINAGLANTAAHQPARITRAVYTARLDDNQLVDGEARLKVACTGDGASVLSLAPCGLAVGKPQWLDDPAIVVNLGMDPVGSLVALVDRDATLQFSWTLRGARDERGQLTFSFQIPAAPISQIQLQLPADLVPVAPDGVVRLAAADREAASAGDDTRMRSSLDPMPQRQWSIELGGHSAAELKIVPEESAYSGSGLVLARQATTYTFTESGLDYQTRLTLDVHHQPLGQLVLQAEPSLRIVAARLGERSVPVLPVSGEPHHIALQFPEPISGTGREVVVTAFAPLVVDQVWRLPAARPVDAVWQQGTATLEVPDTLVLKQLATQACVETSVEPLPSPAEGEARDLQLYQPDAAMDVIIGFQPPQLDVASGTTVRVNETLMTGLQVTRITATRGTSFVLQARIHDGWFIDNVETLSGEADGEIASWSRQGRLMRIRLLPALNPGETLQLVVMAHRRVNALPLDGTRLRVLEFEHARRKGDLISLYAEAPYHLNIARDVDLQRVDPQDLSRNQRELIEAPADAFVFADGPAASGLSFGLNREDPRYSATIAVTAAVESETVRQTYRIRCEPLASRVARLLVHFSQGSEGATNWQLADSRAIGLSAHRQDRSADGVGGEMWEIVLLQPQSEPFEIQAVRTLKFDGNTMLSLASLPGAASQAASLKVETGDGTPLDLRVENLKAVFAEPAPSDAYARTRAVFRYDPSRDALAVVSRAIDVGSQTPAWIWNAQLISRVEATGETTHVAQFRIENSGLPHVSIVLPRNAVHVQGYVNGEEVPLPSHSTSSNRCLVRLPRDVRFPTVRIAYATTNGRLGFTSQIEAPWPQVELPCFDRIWSVWLPPSYAAVSNRSLLRRSHTGDTRWDERLFGFPVLRREAQPFNVFSNADWRRLVRQLESPASGVAAEEFVGVLDTLRADLATPTWGDLVASYQQFVSAEPNRRLPELWIDDDGCREVGISSQSPLPQADEPLVQGTELAMVLCGGAAVLTNPGSLARLDGFLAPTAFDNVFTLGSSKPLAAVLSSASPPLGVRAASRWADGPSLPASPWFGDPWQLELPARGWRNHHFQIGDEGRWAIAVYRPRAVQMFGWGAMLMGAGLVGWLLRRRWLGMVLAIATAAVLTLLCPEELVPVARGLFCGSLLAAALVLIPRPPRYLRADTASESSRSTLLRENSGARTSTLILFLIGGLILTTARPLIGQEVRPAASGGEEVFPLLDPINDENEPAGNYVYVPRPFYQAIQLRSTSAGVSPRSWIVQSATYQVVLDRDDEPAENPPVEVGAEFELEMFEPGVLRLPLDRQEVRLVDAALDGQLIQPLWDAEGKELSFEIASPRRGRLTLSFRPLVQRGAVRSAFEMGIPRIARSRIRVKTARYVDSVEFPTCLGAITREAAQREVVAELGPASRLSVHWRDPELPVGEAPDVETTELLLLKVQPNSVVLDARFTLNVRRGSLQEVRLQADPRLRLLPLSPDQPIRSHEIVEGPLQTIRLELDGSFSEELVIKTSFLLSGTSGIGNLTPPLLRVADHASKSPWLGIWAAPSLDVRVPAELQASSLGVTEFQTLWGGSDLAPQTVVRMPMEEEPWALTIQPARPRTLSRQEQDISISSENTSVQFQARVDMRDGHYLQQRLQLPPTLEIHDLQVTRDGVDRALRWARDGNGALTVFFTSPLSGEHLLITQGEMPTGPVLPVISVENADVSSHEVRIYRQSGVRVTVSETSGLQRLEAKPTGTYRPGSGRLVDTLVSVDDALPGDWSARLTIEPNRPNTRADLVTMLNFRDDQWIVDVDLELRIQRGDIDSVRFDIPRELSEPFELLPPVPYELREAADPNRRVVLIRPEQPVRGRTHFRLRGVLNELVSQRVRAPDIRVLDVRDVRRFLAVPTRLGGQQIAWQTSGLQAASLPAAFEPPQDAPENQTAFRVVGPRLEAIVRDVERVTGAPQVHLADIHLSWRLDGTCYGVALFDLEPARLSGVELALPPALQLVVIRVEGLPVTAKPMGDNRWRLPLGPDQLPQRLEVVFQGKLPPFGTLPLGQVFPAPTLEGLPVLATLWTVHGPTATEAGVPALAHIRSNFASQASQRLESAENMLYSASAVITQSASAEAVSWRDEWERHVAAAKLDVARERQTAATGREPPDAVFAAASANSIGIAHDPVGIWKLQQKSQGAATRCSLRGPASHLVIAYARGGQESMLRAMITVSILGGGVLVCFLLRLTVVADWFARWPYLVGVLLGVAWWLWLTPSLLGLGMVLICVVGALRPRCKSR